MVGNENQKNVGQIECDSWEMNYRVHNYENVLNITADRDICKKISNILDSSITKLLIPGCGSQTFLQDYIVDHFPNINLIVCTDWSMQAIELAKKSKYSDKVIYSVEDSQNFSFADNSFDAILICNSILSASDAINKKIFEECSRVIKQNGILGGLFPSIFSALDISISLPQFHSWQVDGTINLSESKLRENKQALSQILYTPLGLRSKLLASGFEILDLSICFFDSNKLLEESEKIYQIDKHIQCPIWELLLKARKIV